MANQRGVFTLHEIKSTAVRRLVLCATLLPLFLANLVAHTIGWILYCWWNQVGLFRSARHYWNSDAVYRPCTAAERRLTDDELDALLHEVSKVYNHVTGGLLSYPDYEASVVIAEADRVTQEWVDECIAEDREARQ